jgi:NTE family protein
MAKVKVGIALGGGGARGLAHLGVLQVLEEENIPIDVIAGTSMGAIVGALYAYNPKVNEIFAKVRACVESGAFRALMFDLNKEKDREGLLYKFSGFIKRAYLSTIIKTRLSVIPKDRIENVITELLPDINIQQLRIPFSATCTNLFKGEEMIITEGSLRKAVLASSSIPGILPPVDWNGDMITDGGSVSECPINGCRKLGADIIIAVNVKSRKRYLERLDNGLEVISRANYLTGTRLNELSLLGADIVINPAVGNIHWANFKRLDHCAKRGERAVWAKLEHIKETIRKARIKRFIGQIFNK